MTRSFITAALALGLVSCGDSTENATASQRQSNAGAVPSPVASPTTGATAATTSATVSASTTKDASAADFDTFWGRFRKAALAGDEAQIQALSRTTVKMYGFDDDSPTRQVSSAQVPAAVAAALAATDDASDNSPTVRSMFETHLHFAPGEVEGTGQIRFASFVFTPTAGGWRLAELYGDDQ